MSRARAARGTVVLAVLALAACSPAPAGGPPQPSSTSSPRASSSAPVASGDTSSGDAAAAVPAVGDVTRVVRPQDVPVRLEIPAIDLDQPLTGLGSNADGTLEVPVDYQQVGWFEGGPPPGLTGPAVLAGHVDSRSGPAAFYRLRDLRPGDQVVVTSADGARHAFSVDGSQQYPKDDFPTAAVYGPVPGPVLRLLTCGGSFDRSAGHYRDNLVVYAS